MLERLKPIATQAEIPLTNQHGEAYLRVRQELVIEVRAHEVLTHRSLGESIRRWRVSFNETTWTPPWPVEPRGREIDT